MVNKLKSSIKEMENQLSLLYKFKDLTGIECSWVWLGDPVRYTLKSKDSTLKNLEIILGLKPKYRKLPYYKCKNTVRFSIHWGSVRGCILNIYTTKGTVEFPLVNAINIINKLNIKIKGYWENKEFIGNFSHYSFSPGGWAVVPLKKFRPETILKLLSPLF